MKESVESHSNSRDQKKTVVESISNINGDSNELPEVETNNMRTPTATPDRETVSQETERLTRWQLEEEKLLASHWPRNSQENGKRAREESVDSEEDIKPGTKRKRRIESDDEFENLLAGNGKKVEDMLDDDDDDLPDIDEPAFDSMTESRKGASAAEAKLSNVLGEARNLVASSTS